ALIFPNLVEEGLVPAEGSDVYIKNGNARLLILFEQVGRLLEGGEAADTGAVGQVVFVSRSGALNECNLLNRSCVGWSRYDAPGRTVCRCKPLHDDIGDYIAVLSGPVVGNSGDVERRPTGSPYYCTSLDLYGTRGHIEIHGPIFARSLYVLRLGRADNLRGDHIAHRVCEVMRKVGRFYGAQAVIEGIWDFRLSCLRAFPAGRTFFVHIAGIDPDCDREIARFSIDFFHL